MEILERQSPEKKRLLEEVELHKKAMAGEIQSISNRTTRMATHALLIGGAVLVGYLLVQQAAGSSKKSKKKSPPVEGDQPTPEPPSNPLWRMISARVMDTATVFLLEMARQKLAEYLSSRSRENS